MTKREAWLSLYTDMLNLCEQVRKARAGDEKALKYLRDRATNRQYVGPQLEIGRDELNVIFDTDPLADDDGPGVDLAAEAAGNAGDDYERYRERCRKGE